MEDAFLERMSHISSRVSTILEKNEKIRNVIAERIARRDMEATEEEEKEDVQEEELEESEEISEEDQDNTSDTSVEESEFESEVDDNELSACYRCFCGRRRH